MRVCPSLSVPIYVASPDYRSHSSSEFWGLDSDRILQFFIGEIILAKQIDVLP